MSNKRRFIWTPDELSERAEACYQAAFGDPEPVKVAERPVPALLPRPQRPAPIPRGTVVSIAEIRKAQRAERKRKRFNRAVKRNIKRQSKALEESLRSQARAAADVEKACNKAYHAETEADKARAKAQADAALEAMRKARKAVEELRKKLQAAVAWLRAERQAERRLLEESKDRIAHYVRWGILPKPRFEDDED